MTNIILDFGHGGIDENGNYTTAPNKMYTFSDKVVAYEGVLNRQIGKKLQEKLDSKGYNVVTTVSYDDPTDLPLADRVKIANKYPTKGTIFISIHCNASPSHKGRGFEIFTTKGETKSDKLATCIGKEVKPLYTSVDMRLRFDFSDGDLDKEANFYVLRNTKCPAVLLECGFFDNREDYGMISSPNFQERLATSVANGIKNYLNK